MAVVITSKHIADEEYKRKLIGRPLVPWNDREEPSRDTPEGSVI
jgi:hypothetical protein